MDSMDERREIFEHFVKHRREDLKAEKKQKLTQAKSLFSELLKEQLQAGWVDAKTTLSVFLAGLEDRVDVVRLKMIQDESLAFLTIDVQEKLYTKAVSWQRYEEVKQVTRTHNCSLGERVDERVPSRGEVAGRAGEATRGISGGDGEGDCIVGRSEGSEPRRRILHVRGECDDEGALVCPEAGTSLS